MKRRRRGGALRTIIILSLILLFALVAWHERYRLVTAFPSLAGPVNRIESLTGQTTSGGDAGSQPSSVAGASDGMYAYSTLPDDEKRIYDTVYDAIVNRRSDVHVDITDPKTLERVFTLVLADHPGLFWVDGFSYQALSRTSVTVGLSFTPNFTMTAEEQKADQDNVDRVVTDWLSGISSDAGDYEKSVYVFQKVVDETEYDSSAENNQNILSVFLNGRSVCQGYSDAVSYLLQKLGIQSTVVTGTADGVAHAWNLVLLDGAYYYIDATWGDGYYTNSAAEKQGTVNYSFLNTTTEHMNRTHTPSGDLTLPDCSATADNYFVKSGRYFSSFDAGSIGSVFRTAYQNGEKEVSVQFADDSLYGEAKSYFLDQGNIRQFVNLSQIRYLERRDDLVLTLEF